MTDDAYTLEMRLCDDAGMVSRESITGCKPTLDASYLDRLNRLLRMNARAMREKPTEVDEPIGCTGHAHLAGEHIRCTSPAHERHQLPALGTGTITLGLASQHPVTVLDGEAAERAAEIVTGRASASSSSEESGGDTFAAATVALAAYFEDNSTEAEESAADHRHVAEHVMEALANGDLPPWPFAGSGLPSATAPASSSGETGGWTRERLTDIVGRALLRATLIGSAGFDEARKRDTIVNALLAASPAPGETPSEGSGS